jgi:hypothetical protein
MPKRVIFLIFYVELLFFYDHRKCLRGCDRMVVGFTTTYAIRALH